MFDRALPNRVSRTIFRGVAIGRGKPGRPRVARVLQSAIEALEERRLLTVFTVMNTSDTGPGSLRQAILDANMTAAADTINFNISGAGVKTIQPVTALPDIMHPLTIDGYTQPGSSPNTLALNAGDNAVLRVQIDATNASAGLTVKASDTTIKGLVVNRASVAGIEIVSGTNVSVLGNFLGTNVAGTMALPNAFCGVDAESTLARIGGPAPADRNVISGNAFRGLSIGGIPGADGFSSFSEGEGTLVRGNYIGTNAAGTGALSNTNGIDWFATTDVTVGGPNIADGNLISGNSGNGLGSFSGGNINLTLRHNLIGTDRTGTLALGNGNGFVTDGVQFQDNLVFRDNVISGNSGGAIVFSIDCRQTTNLTIADNFIGTDRSATLDLGNGSGFTIGGNDNAITGNVIAHNHGDAMLIKFFDPMAVGVPGTEAGLRNRISQNRIFLNTGKAIDLQNSGVNDPLDADSAGANRLQNFPVITSAVGDSSATAIGGTLNSTPNHTFRIELFRTSAILSIHRDADAFLGAVDVTTDGAGNASFNFLAAGGLAGNSAITATATDTTASTPDIGNTSEISDPRFVTAGAPAAAAVYLSDLTPSFAANGFGPFEKDRSNGENVIGDGNAITLNGATFDKGLGVHGASELRYRLDGAYTHFLTTIGVDDEVGSLGKVVFRVVADGTTLYQSPVPMTGDSASIPLDLNVTGKNELRLIVTTSDDGPNYDHADWADARLTPVPAPVFVSDLTPTFAHNGWGLFERDRSNGETGAHDGHPITLNGVVYAKGLGVVPASDIRYNLAGKYDTFTADIGVDDEVSYAGSVIFQVFADGVKLYDSGLMTGLSATKHVSVGVGGRNELRLVVTDAGNGIAYDHADWADAKLYVTPPLTASTFLSAVTPISATNGFGEFENDRSNGEFGAHDGNPITLNGVVYPNGLGVHANSTLRYNLGGAFTSFAADVGIDDEVASTRGSAIFRVYADGVLLFDSGVMTGASATKQARVNVAGRNELVLQVLEGPGGPYYDHGDWANALVF